jgi:hypothetical protein
MSECAVENKKPMFTLIKQGIDPKNFMKTEINTLEVIESNCNIIEKLADVTRYVRHKQREAKNKIRGV